MVGQHVGRRARGDGVAHARGTTRPSASTGFVLRRPSRPAADRRVDGVRGFLLVVEVADRARLAVRVPVARRPPPLALVPRWAVNARRSGALVLAGSAGRTRSSTVVSCPPGAQGERPVLGRGLAQAEVAQTPPRRARRRARARRAATPSARSAPRRLRRCRTRSDGRLVPRARTTKKGRRDRPPRRRRRPRSRPRGRRWTSRRARRRR